MYMNLADNAHAAYIPGWAEAARQMGEGSGAACAAAAIQVQLERNRRNEASFDRGCCLG